MAPWQSVLPDGLLSCCSVSGLAALLSGRVPPATHLELAAYGVAITVATGIYLSPCIVAGLRNSRGSIAIMCVNAGLGWTVVGWLLALIWAWKGAAIDIDGAGAQAPAAGI